MKVHILSCATMCPLGQRFVNGTGRWFARGRMVCLCLLVETPDGLALVDTGLGLDDVAGGGRLLPLPFRALAAPRCLEEETAARQVERLGYTRADVRHIIPTHLDLDHAGGLADFPRAQVHVHGPELEAALRPRTLLERGRYLSRQWAHGPRWVTHEAGGDRWMGFESVRCVGDIALVPLSGHTRGHCGVAVPTDDDRYILHAGDAFFHHGEMEKQPWCSPGLRLFQRVLAMDNGARLRNARRLWALAQEEPSVDVACAHSPVQFERLRRQRHGRATR